MPFLRTFAVIVAAVEAKSKGGNDIKYRIETLYVSQVNINLGNFLSICPLISQRVITQEIRAESPKRVPCPIWLQQLSVMIKNKKT